MTFTTRSRNILLYPNLLVHPQGDDVVSEDEVMINDKVIDSKIAVSYKIGRLGKKSIIVEQLSEQKVDNVRAIEKEKGWRHLYQKFLGHLLYFHIGRRRKKMGSLASSSQC